MLPVELASLEKLRYPHTPLLYHVLCGVSETMMKCPLSCVFFWPRSGIARSLKKQARNQAIFTEMAGLGLKHLGWLRAEVVDAALGPGMGTAQWLQQDPHLPTPLSLVSQTRCSPLEKDAVISSIQNAPLQSRS